MHIKPLFSFLIIHVFLVQALAVNDYDTVRVSDFGVEANSRQNVTPAILVALERAKTMANPLVIFDPGNYDFWPQNAVEKIYFESNTTDINPKRLGLYIEGFSKYSL